VRPECGAYFIQTTASDAAGITCCMYVCKLSTVWCYCRLPERDARCSSGAAGPATHTTAAAATGRQPQHGTCSQLPTGARVTGFSPAPAIGWQRNAAGADAERCAVVWQRRTGHHPPGEAAQLSLQQVHSKAACVLTWCCCCFGLRRQRLLAVALCPRDAGCCVPTSGVMPDPYKALA
jgi:hypothetical protein